MISRKTPQANLESKRSTWLALGFIASLSIILIALSFTSYDVAIRQALNFEADLLEDEEIPVNIVTPPPPPPPPQQTTVIEIVDDEEEIEEELEIEDIELDEDTEIDIIEDDEDLEDDTPFMIVENMPALGPCKSMRGEERNQCTQGEIIRYVSKNTKYPEMAKDAGIQGTVFVQFVVGKNGLVKDVKILKEVHPQLDKEAKRIVESLPKFEPGKQRGKNVSVVYNIPVRFIIR